MTIHRREHTRLQRWAHRHGIARELNSCYRGGQGWTNAYIETAIPSEWLARWASRSWDSHTTEVERMGVLRRRWLIQFQTRRLIRDRRRFERRRPHLPRFLHRWYARLFGYFWLPCPLCREPFGGHEIIIPEPEEIGIIRPGGPRRIPCPRCVKDGAQ